MTDIHADKGDTNVYDLTAKKPDGSPMDISGASLWFTVKEKEEDLDPGLVQKTLGSGITSVNASQGQAQVVLDPADTANLKVGRYFYDAQVKEAVTERITTIDRGYFLVDPTYTRAT